MREGEHPSPIEIEGLTGVPWTAKTSGIGPHFRVEAVAVGRGMLHDVPVVMFSRMSKPRQIEAMTLAEFRQTMKPVHSGQ